MIAVLTRAGTADGGDIPSGAGADNDDIVLHKMG